MPRRSLLHVVLAVVASGTPGSGAIWLINLARAGNRETASPDEHGSTELVSIVDEVRVACARVAMSARHVRIIEEAIGGYATTLPTPSVAAPAAISDGMLEKRAGYWLQLDAINFGSGWFPTLRKAPGLSGFRTVEAGLSRHGPWSPAALGSIDAREVAGALGQDPGHELMWLFAAHLRELGECALRDRGGSFLSLARSGDGSAVALAERLASLPGWQDVSRYDGQPVAFFKRAQIIAADLHRQGVAPARDLHQLTMFADNLVPHVLRLDGVLEFDPSLVGRIEQDQLIDHGSADEVEIRACALHAVELLVVAHGHTTAVTVDNALWDRGAGARYKAVPRHRARCTAY